ncbi:MAG: cholest-4-en-3-one 26-monooxygenase, partial [Actinomycetota bacterium]|nr:cholest-4-en-3-one 26-monooxygenase [Actinomycetota bacterium]
MPTLVNIYDPDAYVRGVPHDVFAELRRTQPVYFQDMPGEPGYWAVLKHADVVHVAREPNLFSASEGGVVLENLAPDQLEMMRHMLLAMDPPRHVDYRRPLASSFKARVIATMDGAIRQICREIMEEAAAKGDVEFVHDVTSALPSRVIGQLMGLPTDDLPLIHRLAEKNTSGQDADYADVDNSGSIEMAMYAIEFAARRRGEEPREDLTTLILGTEFGGELMTDIDFGSFFVQLVTAGNDTTKTMLSSGLLALLEHPEQLDALARDRSLVAGAVEEILRFANPLHYFRRTASADTVLHDVEIKAGDKVAMYYTSANRDEDVFDEPDRFDICRTPNPHLSFGVAEHFCLGVHLARLEGRVFFEELLSTFSTIELTGEPKRVRSNLNNALKSLPVRLT